MKKKIEMPQTTDMRTALLAMHGETIRHNGQRWKLEAREWKGRFDCNAQNLDPKDDHEALYCITDLERSLESESAWALRLAFAVAGGYVERHPNPNGVIPEHVRKAAAKVQARIKKENYGQCDHRPVPVTGIPVVFAQRGTYKAGTAGWIIAAADRRVFLGNECTETLVGEFTVVIESGHQCLAQVGRDINFVS